MKLRRVVFDRMLKMYANVAPVSSVDLTDPAQVQKYKLELAKAFPAVQVTFIAEGPNKGKSVAIPMSHCLLVEFE